MFRRMSVALLAVTVFLPLSPAQMRGAFRGTMRGAHSGFGRAVRGGMGLRHNLRPFGQGLFLGWPLPYSDDSGAEYVVDGASPQEVVLQPAAADDFSRQAKPQPLLIELRGDRYVRFGGTTTYDENGTSAHPGYAPEIAQPVASAALGERAESPAVLVYRDGHREEISGYAIADGVIYVRGNYWQNGYWTKRIPLSEVDAPATMQANQQRGVKFLLPSAPNVVIASF